MLESQNLTLIEIWNQFIDDGDELSLSFIYKENYNVLYDYGMRYTSHNQLVEDSIQEVFISIMKYRKNIGVVKNVQGYLISSFRRQLILNINKQKKNVQFDQLSDVSFEYFKNEDVNELSAKEDTEFLHDTINDCLQNLTNKQREIIFLRFEREIPYEEIAKILNISVESCYKSIYRTIKTIRVAAEKKIVSSGKLIFGLTADQINKIKTQPN